MESAEEDQLVLSLRPDVSGVDGATQAAADPVRLVMLLGPGPDAGQRRVVSFHTEPDTLPVADLLEAVRGGRHTELGLASDQLRVVPEGAPWVVRHVAARAARHASLAREVEVVGKRCAPPKLPTPPSRFRRALTCPPRSIPGALVHADENDSAVNATLPCGAVAAVSVDPSYPGVRPMAAHPHAHTRLLSPPLLFPTGAAGRAPLRARASRVRRPGQAAARQGAPPPRVHPPRH